MHFILASQDTVFQLEEVCRSQGDENSCVIFWANTLLLCFSSETVIFLGEAPVIEEKLQAMLPTHGVMTQSPDIITVSIA